MREVLQMSVPARAQIEAMVSEKLASDPTFRSQLLADPRAVLSDLLGVEIPESVVIEVHEESLAHFHLVIPNDDAVRDISDSELELVAGGLQADLSPVREVTLPDGTVHRVSW